MKERGLEVAGFCDKLRAVTNNRKKPPGEYSYRRLCVNESLEVARVELVARVTAVTTAPTIAAAVATYAKTATAAAAVFARLGLVDVQISRKRIGRAKNPTSASGYVKTIFT